MLTREYLETLADKNLNKLKNTLSDFNVSVNGYEDWKASDLRDLLIDFTWNGCKGIKDYTRDEVIKEILDDILDFGNDDESAKVFNELYENTPDELYDR